MSETKPKKNRNREPYIPVKDRAKPTLPDDFSLDGLYSKIHPVGLRILETCGSVRTAMNAVKVVLIHHGLWRQWLALKNNFRKDMKQEKLRLLNHPDPREWKRRSTLRATPQMMTWVKIALLSLDITVENNHDFDMTIYSDARNKLIHPEGVNKWKVLSRSSFKEWTVKRVDDRFECNCPAFLRMNHCFHTKVVEAMLKTESKEA